MMNSLYFVSLRIISLCQVHGCNKITSDGAAKRKKKSRIGMKTLDRICQSTDEYIYIGKADARVASLHELLLVKHSGYHAHEPQIRIFLKT